MVTFIRSISGIRYEWLHFMAEKNTECETVGIRTSLKETIYMRGAVIWLAVGLGSDIFSASTWRDRQGWLGDIRGMSQKIVD